MPHPRLSESAGSTVSSSLASKPLTFPLPRLPTPQLREIEIIVAARLEEPDETPEEEILKKIQDILYQTEVGRGVQRAE